MDEKKIYDKMESDTKEQFKSWKESKNDDLENNYITFLEMLFRLRQICNHTQLLYVNVKFVRFDGKMLHNQRKKAINNFNNNPEGLNLTTANQCFIMDSWWNPSIED
ncbi:hypothetical protein RhiirA4_472273 [Rhizophagus irregularis]|uniref:Helicase C-terminal domain-containing protein n=1 Tax=Rhizophagus irregularis TaxID=588596 RepID=A0A2I1H4N2_9GLOM|nr:hypothetical protein RhiirA4_472273 [Rhizophagus irregularis]